MALSRILREKDGRRQSLLASLAAGFLAFLLALAPLAATAAEKVALLIGNAAYQRGSSLSSPIRDARAMAALLEGAGFETTILLNASETAMGSALRDFSRRARSADTALFYFSGHGMEIENANYLIPVDAELRHPGDARFEAVGLDHAVSATQGAKHLSVSIIDACRNNTFPSATKSSVKGFRPVAAPSRGQVIAFATAPGTVAYGGSRRLSPYTEALLEALRDAPDQDVRLLFTSLGDRVSELAGADQEPFARFGRFPKNRSVSLLGAGRRRPAAAAAPSLAPACSGFREQTLFEAAQLSDEARQVFLETCPESPLIAALPQSRRPANGPEAAPGLPKIRNAQASLKKLGLYDGPVDGRSNPQLDAAIRELQALASLTVDGVLNDETTAVLSAAERFGLQKLVDTSSEGALVEDVRDAQRALRTLGFYPQGPRDGKMNLAFKRAIRDFQDRVGLPANGALDAQTRAALRDAENLGLERVVARSDRSDAREFEVTARALLLRRPDPQSPTLYLLESGARVTRLSSRPSGSGRNVYYHVRARSSDGRTLQGYVLRGFLKALQ